MTLLEVLPYVRCLSKSDQYRLIELLAGEFAREISFAPKTPARTGTESGSVTANPLSTSLEEQARRGQEIYERNIRPTLRPEDDGKYIAIDVASGVYEMDTDERVVSDRLYARRPESQPWVVRVSYRVAGLPGGSGEKSGVPIAGGAP